MLNFHENFVEFSLDLVEVSALSVENSVLLCCHVTMLAKRVFLENPVESKAFVERNIRQIWKVTFLVIQIIIVYLGFSGFDGKKYQINTKMTINVQ